MRNLYYMIYYVVNDVLKFMCWYFYDTLNKNTLKTILKLHE